MEEKKEGKKKKFCEDFKSKQEIYSFEKSQKSIFGMTSNLEKQFFKKSNIKIEAIWVGIKSEKLVWRDGMSKKCSFGKMSSFKKLVSVRLQI